MNMRTKFIKIFFTISNIPILFVKWMPLEWQQKLRFHRSRSRSANRSSPVPVKKENTRSPRSPPLFPATGRQRRFFGERQERSKTVRGKTKSKSRAQKNRRYAPCGTISCFIRPLFSFCGGSVGVPCLLLTEKTNTCDERASAKTIRYPVKQRPETICQTEKVISWRTGGHGGRI